MGKTLAHHSMAIRSNRNCTRLMTLGNSYLTLSYIVVRVLWLVVALVSITLLTQLSGGFLQTFDIFWHLSERDESVIFPRIILCDYSVGITAGRQHNYVVQCVLDHGVPVTILLFIMLCFYVLCAVNVDRKSIV